MQMYVGVKPKQPAPSLDATSAGVGFKSEHADDILGSRARVDFFEIHAENYMGAYGPPHHLLRQLTAKYGAPSTCLVFTTGKIEQSERRPHRALKQRAAWSRTRQNADAEKHPEQQACTIVCIDTARCRSIGLRCENAPFEKPLDFAKLFSNHGAKLALMWRDLERRIDEEASFALSIIDRVVNDLGKELTNRLFGGQRRLVFAQPTARRAVEISIQGADKKSLLVPEGIIEARRG
jgi:hypothetical protein